MRVWATEHRQSQAWPRLGHNMLRTAAAFPLLVLISLQLPTLAPLVDALVFTTTAFVLGQALATSLGHVVRDPAICRAFDAHVIDGRCGSTDIGTIGRLSP